MNNLKLISILLFIPLIFSCTRKQEGTSTLSITIGEGVGGLGKTMSANGNLNNSLQSVSAQSGGDDGPEWNTALNPSEALTDTDTNAANNVNCIGVMIEGPESEMRRNRCTNETLGTGFNVGRWVGAIPYSNGATLQLDVPAGSQRTIRIVGWHALSGACINLKNSDIDENNMSQPVVIGQRTMDFPAGSVNASISIPNTINSANFFDDCSGPDFSLNGEFGLYFGDATSGTLSVNAGTDITDAGMFGANAGAYAKINGIVPLANGVGVDLGTVDGTFANNDEVMIIPMAGKGILGPNTPNDYDSCGYRNWTGGPSFGRIVSVTPNSYTGTDYSVSYDIVVTQGTQLSNLWKDANGDSNEFDFRGLNADDIKATNIRLAQAETAATFCNMQVIKVPHFYNLTIETSRVVFPPNFGWNIGGGVLALRVNGTLTMQDGSFFEAINAGFPGLASYKGGGTYGSEACATSPANSSSNGGACGNASTTAGAGGGHGSTSTPAYGSASGGDGEGGTSGGTSVGEDCGDGSCFKTLRYKIFMGGAGGADSGAYAGQPGGGIVYIMARNLVIPCSSCTTSPEIRVNGASSANTAGAGAGGSILLGYKNATNLSSLELEANGGANSNQAKDPGTGAGGRIETVSCTSAAPTNIYFNGGSNSLGTSGQAGSTGSYLHSVVTCN